MKRISVMVAFLVICISWPMMAKTFECYNSYVQHWIIYSTDLPLPVGCLEGGNWDIDIDKNLGLKQKQQLCAALIANCGGGAGDDGACFMAFDTCGYSTSGPCKKWISRCKSGDGEACIISKEYCGYTDACYYNWKPRCDDDDQCLFAYNKCGNYLSDNCTTAGLYCYYLGWCDYWNDPCMRNYPCEEFKKHCKEKKSVAACELAVKECGLNVCRDV